VIFELIDKKFDEYETNGDYKLIPYGDGYKITFIIKKKIWRAELGQPYRSFEFRNGKFYLIQCNERGTHEDTNRWGKRMYFKYEKEATQCIDRLNYKLTEVLSNQNGENNE